MELSFECSTDYIAMSKFGYSIQCFFGSLDKAKVAITLVVSKLSPNLICEKNCKAFKNRDEILVFIKRIAEKC